MFARSSIKIQKAAAKQWTAVCSMQIEIWVVTAIWLTVEGPFEVEDRDRNKN